MSQHIDSKHKIQDLRYDDFNSLLDSCLISDENKKILRMIYVEDKPLGYIGDILGYSEATIKARHRKLLKQITKLL